MLFRSIYAIKDELTNTGWGDVRANTTAFVQQTFTVTGTTASVSKNPVNFLPDANGGWWIDLPNSGERVSTDMSLQFDTLVIGTAIPSGDACASGGSSWRYFLNVATGGVVTTNPAGQLWNANALIVGMSWVKDSDGNVRIIYQDSKGGISSEIPPIKKSSLSSGAHRTSWRELTN